MSADNLDSAKLILELRQIKSYLENEAGLSCQLQEASASVPTPSLTVMFLPEEQPITQAASIMFLPLEEEDLENIKLLQLHTQLPIELGESSVEAVKSFLLIANSTIPVGAFSLDQDRQIAYKYVYSLGKFKPVETEEFIETFLLWMYTLNFTSQLVQELAQGEIDLDTACAKLAL